MNYGRSILVSKKDVAIFNFIITLKLILPYRKKLGQPQNIHGLNLTNKFVLFYCLFFFAVAFAECSLGDGLILLVFYLLTKLVLFLGNENMVGLVLPFYYKFLRTHHACYHFGTGIPSVSKMQCTTQSV